jgi:hypothetical protein
VEVSKKALIPSRAIILLLIFISGWNSPAHAANELEEGEIRYVVSGGIAGMVYTNLTITPEGIAINKKYAPHIKKQLTPEEYKAIRSKVAKIGAYPKTQGYLEIGDTNWRCLGFACETPSESKTPTVEICRELQKKVGKIKTFERDGTALGAPELARCNQK